MEHGTSPKAPGPKHGPGVRIREMELEDLAPVFALGEALFTAEAWPNLYRTWDEYELVDMFASEGETCLVAESEDDGRLLGFVLGTLIEKRRSAWTYGYLVWLAVSPEARRLGVGRRLTEKLTEIFIEMGARMMLVDTDAENEPAIDFFQSQGFRQPRRHVYLTRNLTTTAQYKRARARTPGGKAARMRPRLPEGEITEPEE